MSQLSPSPDEPSARRIRHPTSSARSRLLFDAYGFGLFPLPAYAVHAREGEWEILAHGPGLSCGYLTRTSPEPGRHVLYRCREPCREPWMSTGLMEQESHAPHVAAAQGVVVAAGLGMGLFVHAALRKKEVERVIAIESSPEVVRLIEKAACPRLWPGAEKLCIVLGDALTPETAEAVLEAAEGRRPDYLYVDVWPLFPAPEAPQQTALIVSRLSPAKAGWWGQELSFAQWCEDQGRAPDQDALRRYAAHCRTPLETSAPYAAFCRDVAAVRRRRPSRLGAIASSLRHFLFGAGKS